ncbi:MAG: hypothetical protein KGY66_02655 [Candidatus Thermoplasmatota archaeon]|nr:hypothetical protein [Candidatus Thermoplasmatota archaeon]MBS3789794.1 hypothetical protein [Candidatus Thermoplasmatota archaeon]
MDKLDREDKMNRKLLTLVITSLFLLNALIVAVGVSAAEEKEKIETQVAQEVNDWNDLDDVRNDLGGVYVLMADLDEDTSGYNQLVDTQDGWNPIENFAGTFYGNGYKISDLYIDRNETSHVGLFGSIENGSEVTELGLLDVHVKGKISVGGLVGTNYGGTVSKSFTVGNVSGKSYHIGGLVGANNNGTVSKSFVAGKVSGGSNAGGLVGHNSGSLATVENSYTNAGVSGYFWIGGLVGKNDKGTITTSYSSGGVGGQIEGGLVGWNDGLVLDSYWDNGTAEIDTSDGELGPGTPLKTNEMTGEAAPNNMDSFDFEAIWETVEKDDVDADKDGYPILQDLSREEQVKHAYPVEDDVEAPEINIPGFTSSSLLLAVIICVTFYHKKRQNITGK